MIFAVVPIKAFDAAKTRLGERLDARQRASLAQACAERVLAAFAACAAVDQRIAVVDSDAAATMARRHGFAVLRRDDVYTQSEAVGAGFAAAREAGATTLVTVSADVPLTRPAEIDELLRGDGPVLVAASNRAGEGTNAMRLTPAADVPLHFGPGSLVQHRREAERLGLEFRVLGNARLRLDVDTSDDLDALEATPDGRRVLIEAGQLLLQASGPGMWTPSRRPA